MSFAFMPIYTGDYLRDTQHLTPAKHGIYLKLLMHCWDQRGPIPLDEQECAGICNCRSADEIEALRYILRRYFVQMNDGWYNKRMTEEVAIAERISQQNSAAGKKSAQTRAAIREKVISTRVERVLNARLTPVGTPTTTPTTTKDKDKDKDKDAAEAADVWAYGLEILTKECGLSAGSARGYIGALCKQWSEATVLDALMAATGKADPKAYARKWIDDKPKKGQARRSAAEELMEEMNANQRPA